MDSLGRDNYYARFYIRRALRILPLYYLLVLILGTVHEASWNYTLVCALFLANMPKILVHGAYYGKIPAWSLAVEEQFYLVWPTVCRALRRRWLIAFCLASMLICPALRSAAYAHMQVGAITSKTWMIGDNLAVGALIAALLRTPSVTRQAIKWAGFIVFAGSFSLLLITTHRYGNLKGICPRVRLRLFAYGISVRLRARARTCHLSKTTGSPAAHNPRLSCRHQLRSLSPPHRLHRTLRSLRRRRISLERHSVAHTSGCCLVMLHCRSCSFEEIL